MQESWGIFYFSPHCLTVLLTIKLTEWFPYMFEVVQCAFSNFLLKQFNTLGTVRFLKIIFKICKRMWTRWVFISVWQGNISNAEGILLSTSSCVNSGFLHLHYLTFPAWHEIRRDWLINVPLQHMLFPKQFKKFMNI